MSAPRGLTAEEVAMWERLAATVTPLHPRAPVSMASKAITPAPPAPSPKRARAPAPAPLAPPRPAPPADPAGNLDSHWERRIKGGALVPDFTLDLHGHTLDSAYARLIDGLTQARGMGARVVLVIAGKPRPAEAADRGSTRGAIRAKLLDWLAASSHGSAIAAIRKAQQRHGGEGALYVVLRKGA